MVTVSGHGLPKSAGTSPQTWFLTECTAAVRGRVDPSTDTPHCDITHAQGIKVTKAGTFTARYRLTTGIIGDGYCGTPGHATCVIGVGTAQGLGTVVRITFKTAPAADATDHDVDHDVESRRLTASRLARPTDRPQAACSHSRWL